MGELIGRFMCAVTLHDDEVADWQAVEGLVRCKRCGREAPMTGAVLAEWIRYRTRRDGYPMPFVKTGPARTGEG